VQWWKSMKQETIEGPEAAARFDALVRKVLFVPHDEIVLREAEYKRQAAKNGWFRKWSYKPPMLSRAWGPNPPRSSQVYLNIP
jgi:hypothetical protein